MIYLTKSNNRRLEENFSCSQSKWRRVGRRKNYTSFYPTCREPFGIRESMKQD